MTATQDRALAVVAGVFPGQGSQSPGMGRELRRLPRGTELLGRAEESSDLPLAMILDRGSIEEVAHPAVAQLAIFTHSVAAYDLWCQQGPAPTVVAGHSVGEYAAMVAAGMLSVDHALDLVSARGRWMAHAADRSDGTMGAVVGLPREQVQALCSAASVGPVVLANHNSPRQVVVSGATPGVEEVLAAAAADGALRAQRLAVGGAYHSPLMVTADAAMANLWDATPLQEPSRAVALVSSRTGEVVRDPERQRELMRAQVGAPVRWDAVMVQLVQLGVTDIAELGPGKVLRGLAREQAPGLRLHSYSARATTTTVRAGPRLSPAARSAP